MFPALLRLFQCIHFVSTYKRIGTGRNGSTKSGEIRVIATFYLGLDSFGSPTPQTQNLARGDSRGGSTPPSGTNRIKSLQQS